MKDQIESAEHRVLFEPDTPERASELLRLTLPLLSQKHLPSNPVNFSLIYHYVAGRDARLREKLDELLNGEKTLSNEEANRLFRRFLYGCDNEVLDDLRDELLCIVAQAIGSLIDLAGKTAVTNKNLSAHVDSLANSQKPQDVLSAVGAIMAETRALVTETGQLEKQLCDSSEEMEKLKEELAFARHEAAIDPLTGLLHRRSFDEALSDLYAQAEESPAHQFSLLMLDLDHFKQVNDRYGHLLGDKVLSAVGQVLNKHTKGGDISARYGGEEFAILLPETRLTAAFNLAENLRLSIKRMVLKRPKSGEVLADISVSIGVAAYRPGESSEDMLSRCDKALYRSKELGRNRVVIAD